MRIHSRCSSLAVCALLWVGLALGVAGCDRSGPPVEAAHAAAPTRSASGAGGQAVGFDRNDYPGDDAMAGLHKTFAFAGYWITNPPGEAANTWAGKRELLRQQGWGFLLLANGRLDAEILKSAKAGTPAAALAKADAAKAVAAAAHEGFPAHTILFLDQEEGGSLLSEQAAYLLSWTEAVAASGFRAGVYASGQPVPDGPGKTITTIEDIRDRVQQGHLHPIVFFDAQDACPPAPGCTVHPKPLTASGEAVLHPGGDLIAWQYAQSPRRPSITRACAATYASPQDGQNNCYAPGFPALFLDIDTASSTDPSQGR